MKYSYLNFRLTALLLVCATSLFGQKLEPKKRPTDPDTTITSKIMGKNYQLYISFPRSYSTKDTIKYPVLYVLDGRNAFPIFNAARTLMEMGREVEDVIIVGIGSGLDGSSWFINRTYDYTPSQDTAADRDIERQFKFTEGELQSGGAEKFLRCMKSEIIPFIESHYKTTNDRGISGHSLGGLFAAYCLLNTKGIFNRYGISSPSLWWHNSETLNQAELFSKKSSWNAPTGKVFLSIGQKDDSTMVSDMVKFRTILQTNAFKNVSLLWNIFQDATHLSALPPALTRTLSALYGIRN